MVSLSLTSVTVRLGERCVVQDISTQCEAGFFIGVIGPNGAGKSTLIRAIMGLIPVNGGSIHVDGKPLATVSRANLARTLAYLPQGQTLHWPLSVERLVALGRLPHLAPFSRLSNVDHHAIEAAMARADVTHLRDRDATELSGGERARVMLARALAVGAKGLIADEPLASLDPGHQIDVMELLAKEASNGTLVIAVLHDLTMAARYCQHLLLINRGRLIAEGRPADVLSPANLATTYGIDSFRAEDRGKPLIVPVSRVASQVDPS